MRLRTSVSQLEQNEDARVYAKMVLDQRADFSVNSYVEARAIKESSDRDHLRDSLLKSGLPE